MCNEASTILFYGVMDTGLLDILRLALLARVYLSVDAPEPRWVEASCNTCNEERSGHAQFKQLSLIPYGEQVQSGSLGERGGFLSFLDSMHCPIGSDPRAASCASQQCHLGGIFSLLQQLAFLFVASG